jgi:hypothetical protein
MYGIESCKEPSPNDRYTAVGSRWDSIPMGAAEADIIKRCVFCFKAGGQQKAKMVNDY